MHIKEMSREECFSVLARNRVARLSCARQGQPYVVPVYLVYDRVADEHLLYGFTTLGQKVEWMRENPLVCVEYEEVSALDQWVTVIVSGRYEELPDNDEHRHERLRAHALLQQHAFWWEPGSTARAAAVHRHPAQPFEAVFYCIHITRITCHLATDDPASARRAH
jgi:uncharacterized protein